MCSVNVFILLYIYGLIILDMNKENKGFYFEEISKRYLQSNGYIILETNFFCRLGEIDIIALKDNVISFIEVKGRKNTDFGYPREYVTPSKIKKIISTAKYYLMKKNYSDINCKFDVIEIISDKKIINYIENAFEAY